MYNKAKLYYDMLNVGIKYHSDHCRGIKSRGVHWNGWKRSRECFSMKDKQWKMSEQTFERKKTFEMNGVGSRRRFPGFKNEFWQKTDSPTKSIILSYFFSANNRLWKSKIISKLFKTVKSSHSTRLQLWLSHCLRITSEGS